MLTIPYMIKSSGDIVITQPSGIPSVVSSSSTNYKAVVDAIKDMANRDADIADLLSPTKRVERFLETSTFKNLKYVPGKGVTDLKGNVLQGSIFSRIIKMDEQGFDSTPLQYFADKLYNNPSKRALDRLFDFVEFGGLPITPDGDFIAYKAVTQKDGHLVDCYTRSIINDVGTVVEMPRNQVEEDPDITCSHGLHACSFEYLRSFHGSDVVAVKINPADVVAIPTDYNNTKMRVCRYEVVQLLSTFGDRSHVLGESSVYDQDGDDFDDEDEYDEYDEDEDEDEDEDVHVSIRGDLDINTRDYSANVPPAVNPRPPYPQAPSTTRWAVKAVFVDGTPSIYENVKSRGEARKRKEELLAQFGVPAGHQGRLANVQIIDRGP